ncbi:hypothetical protein HYH03_004219 [Edaphochlamys debaryana]|uniref:Uncharacterized protein n=1 Tax=Edaphochlamys debaryana TaxID=47281 RepID=A0A835Y8C6_9CHLO|nr:hypothetical protein HYH03_004219 [Edaphochlamys debaryana]|eukprot:KAG2497958.1 hypothetical protein HYH03_004219 [Edaphochlamys debaryana]
MEFATSALGEFGHDVPYQPHYTDERSLEEETRTLEAFLRGQGHLSPGVALNLCSASAEDARHTIQLIQRLACQQQQDDRAREALRDQVDRSRSDLALVQKRGEELERARRALAVQVKELEGKLLATKHKAEETEKELKAKLQSANTRLNGYLYGGRDAAKRNSATGNAAGGGAGGGGGAGLAGGARRVAFDRFRDDPEDSAAVVQKLEAECAQLRQQVKQLTATRKAQAGPPRLASAGSVDSPRTYDQSSGGTAPGEPDLQAVRAALSEDLRRDLDVAVARAAAGLSPTSPDPELDRMRRTVRDLRANVEHLQRQVDRGAAERAELHKHLHSARSRCASLEVEKRNAEDRAARAQRAAAAAALEPSEAQAAELRQRLEAAERERAELKARAADLQLQLVAAEAGAAANARHVETLKRAIRNLPGGAATGAQLEQLVAGEVAPLREELEGTRAQLAETMAQLEGAREELAAALRRAEAPGAGAGPGGSTTKLPPSPTDRLPLSPAMAQPSSPQGAFDGFAPGPLPSSESPPPLLQNPPTRGSYHKTLASTMPSPANERAFMYASYSGDVGSMHLTHVVRHDQPFPAAEALVSTAGPVASTTDDGAFGSMGGVYSTSGGGAGPGSQGGAGASWRRSLSAGPVQRSGGAYRSVERAGSRRQWQVPSNRSPSPIEIMMEQARNPAAAEDPTLSIRPGPSAAGAAPGGSPA